MASVKYATFLLWLVTVVLVTMVGTNWATMHYMRVVPQGRQAWGQDAPIAAEVILLWNRLTEAQQRSWEACFAQPVVGNNKCWVSFASKLLDTCKQE